MVWDVATGGVRLTLSGSGGTVTHVSFSPDGAHLAAASVDQTVKIWDAASGKEVLTLYEDSTVSGVAFGPGPCEKAAGLTV